ncbi:ABC transporter ATP-binding protein [Pelomonas sp. Root662]|nr:ABC transporter ATP-binding protein [Pelomonas sp. Root405]KRA73818.1 ABC transporter ATP-binding protein [Pelomonas sp. Root662]
MSYPKGPLVLNGLDWQLLPGQVVGLLGRNGAGKTTLLEALLGLREPQAGTVKMFGQDVLQLNDATRARIGYVPQQSELFEGFTPAQLLAYFRSFYPRWNEAKVEGLLSRWDIARDKPIRNLSGGQKQRLSIIRALAHEPDLLVLDEPVASLDPAGRRDFLRELVGEVLDRGATVVFSTHILSDLERVAFNLAFMSGGRIALQAPLDELLEQVRAFTGTVTEMATLMSRLGAQALKRTPLEAGRERVLARLPAATTVPVDVAADRVNLDDLFAELT